MLVLAIQTGLGISEIVGLNKEDLSLGTGAHVHCLGKGRKHRNTPLLASTVAVAWQRASARDWTTYAADYSCRGTPKNVAKPAHDDHS